MNGFDLFELVEEKIKYSTNMVNGVDIGQIERTGYNSCRALMKKELEREIVVDKEGLEKTFEGCELITFEGVTGYFLTDDDIYEQLSANPKAWLKVRE